MSDKNDTQLQALFDAWWVIDGTENALGEYIHGTGTSIDDMHDVLAMLIEANSDLAMMLAQILGERPEIIRDKILDRQRKELGIRRIVRPAGETLQ